MYIFDPYNYPKESVQLEKWDKHSPYLVRIVAPIDMKDAFYDYANNYYKAAHIIARYLLERDNVNNYELDTYFFSLAFLYRHSIELLLKANAFKWVTNEDERIDFVKSTHHNLEEMVVFLKSVSQFQRSDDEIEWLERYFNDISEVDKSSDSFRYPFHVLSEYNELYCELTYSIKRIFEEQTHIDLYKFVNKFEVAFEILNNWYLENNNCVDELINLEPFFIENGGCYNGQSVVGYGYRHDDFYPYIKAYFDTACYLREYMKEECDLGNKEISQELFFPMCYLYRNCTELILKSILFEESGEDFQERCRVMLDKKHSILGMWSKLKPFIVKCCDDYGEQLEELDAIEDYCKQLHNIDSDASKFRYPSQKNLKPYFKINKRFDFLHVGEFLEALNNSLDGINCIIDKIKEYNAQMESEFYDY